MQRYIDKKKQIRQKLENIYQLNRNNNDKIKYRDDALQFLDNKENLITLYVNQKKPFGGFILTPPSFNI